MTIDAWLQLAVTHLKDAGIDSARLDALILLEDALQLDKSYLLAHPEAVIAPAHLETLAGQLERRDQHEPLAYIRGFSEFYGRRFAVTPDVLVPRPESESMIELYKKYYPAGTRVADIGTGSGCLAVTAALETNAVVYAVDIDKACLEVAAHNAAANGATVNCLVGSLAEPLAGLSIGCLLANLPYVPNNYPINEAAKHEPALALFAGDDGLDWYRALFLQPQQATIIITEALEQQQSALTDIAAASGYALRDHDGLAQVFTFNG